jgi:hypothetical protein
MGKWNGEDEEHEEVPLPPKGKSKDEVRVLVASFSALPLQGFNANVFSSQRVSVMEGRHSLLWQ